MASTIAIYPKSHVSTSKKNRVREFVRRLGLPSLALSTAMKHVLDFVLFVAFLIALFMVPA